jgi:peroxiredoxin
MLDARSGPAIGLGDPVPWFSARTITGQAIELHVDAGRWIVLMFFGALDDARAAAALECIRSNAALLDADRLIFLGVLSEPPNDMAAIDALSGPACKFIVDQGGAIGRVYGAEGAPRTIVLDPMLRAVANIPFDHPNGHAAMVEELLKSLPEIDASAGVPLFAPALIVPRVFEFPFCELLVKFYEEMGGSESGFLLDRDGKTQTVVDHRYKSRRDLVIVEPNLREAIRDRVVRRLVPEIRRYFQFDVTRMDRYMVSCYDAARGGHFSRHRDNVNAGARHRRFAASINLNSDYEGGTLTLPEFGRRSYAAPVGGAIVFSCGALHQVAPVTKGKRYAFVPFFYDEPDAALRTQNNALLQAGEAPYTGDRDRLFTSIVPDLPAGETVARTEPAAT